MSYVHPEYLVETDWVNANLGKPGIRLHGELARWFEARGLRAHLSVTDETDYAAAFVVVEKTTS